MSNIPSRLEQVLSLNKPIKCPYCGGKLFQEATGYFRCHDCNEVTLDDYGKVREFLEQNGPTPYPVISNVTGVKMSIITMLLEHGKLEIPNGSSYYLQCKSCGCSLRYGQYCSSCAKDAFNRNMINVEVIGQKPSQPPKTDLNPEMKGKMHYIGKRR